MYNLIIITGPTAVGKTNVSLNIASKLKTEIISADSMQIYKYMDIGTNKIKHSDMNNIKHHIIDCIYPDEEFSVSDFKEKASNTILELNNNNSIPIIVGGTGLYINSLIYDLNFSKIKANESIRKYYDEMWQLQGKEKVFDILKIVDPVSAIKININDKKRVIRALEIYEISGIPMSKQSNDFRKQNNKYNLLFIGLNLDRQKLYPIINDRIDTMIGMGLISEVKNLLSKGYYEELNSMQAIGYKEVIMYIKNEIDYETMLSLLKRNSRRYAKRQMTWFRKDDRIKWINVDNFNSKIDLYNYIYTLVKEKFNIY